MGDDYDLSSEIKKEVNNLIWMYGKKDKTLEDAEITALVMY